MRVAPLLFSELREGQGEEHLELGVRLWNGINEVIAMQRLGRLPRANLNGLRQSRAGRGSSAVAGVDRRRRA